MEIDVEQYKDFIVRVIKLLKQQETEILTYRMVVNALRVTDPYLALDDALASARQNVTIRKAMDAKYDVYLERVLRAVDRTALEQQLGEFLRSWKPTGSPQ